MIDIVCGMDVTEKRFCSIFEGEKYFFCSQLCKEEFDRDPESYIHGKGLKNLLTRIYPVARTNGRTN